MYSSTWRARRERYACPRRARRTAAAQGGYAMLGHKERVFIPLPAVSLYDVLARLGKAGWYVQGMSQDDMVFLPRGLGVIAIFTRKPFLAEVDVNANPVDVIYLDASGGLVVDVPTASLVAPKPDRSTDCTPLIERLVKRVDQASTMLCTLLRERGYSGRLQARVRVNTGMGYDLRPGILTGSAMISITDDLDTVRNALMPMLSQVTRSWLDSPFTILRWNWKEPTITSL